MIEVTLFAILEELIPVPCKLKHIILGAEALTLLLSVLETSDQEKTWPRRCRHCELSNSKM